MADKTLAHSGSSFKGRFITFEGGEGVGKSTQALRLRERLEHHGIEVVLTREPGGAPGAEAIRGLLVTGGTDKWTPMTETLLHYAARRDHLDRTVLPALRAGKWVICDRYADSTLAYQGYAQGLGVDRILDLHKIVTDNFWPDFTLLLNGGASLGLERARMRQETETGQQREDRYERMGKGFHEKLREAFLDIAAKNPQRITVIAAEGRVDDVEERIWQCVKDRFGLE